MSLRHQIFTFLDLSYQRKGKIEYDIPILLKEFSGESENSIKTYAKQWKKKMIEKNTSSLNSTQKNISQVKNTQKNTDKIEKKDTLTTLPDPTTIPLTEEGYEKYFQICLSGCGDIRLLTEFRNMLDKKKGITRMVKDNAILNRPITLPTLK